MDKEIEELLSLIDEYKGVVTPENFEKIRANEEILQKIDAMNQGWYKLYSKASSRELGWEIRDKAIDRANSFDSFMSFIHDDGCGKIASVGALFHAETFAQKKKVATATKSFRVCIKAFNQAFDLIQSGEEAAEMLCNLYSIKEFQLENSGPPHEMLTKKTIRKGVAASKNITVVAKVYKEGSVGMQNSTSACKHVATLIVAEELAASVLKFENRKLLEKQVEYCRTCTREEDKKGYSALASLLKSIIEFDKYQRLSFGRKQTG